jgi:UV radiation resistance-associated gene protein
VKEFSRPSTPPTPQPKVPFATAPSLPSIPNYLSGIHRPSTNPSFSLDPRSGYEFAEWTDLSANKLKIEVWGKVGARWRQGSVDRNEKGKGKEVDHDAREAESEWKVLEEWNVSLADLQPLPQNVSAILGKNVTIS